MQRKPALRNAIPVAQAPFMRGPKRRDKVVGSGRVGSGPRRFKTAATSSVQMSAPSPGSKRSQPASTAECSQRAVTAREKCWRSFVNTVGEGWKFGKKLGHVGRKCVQVMSNRTLAQGFVE